jgi:RNA polymerase sigma factor (sigma-70 family)
LWTQNFYMSQKIRIDTANDGPQDRSLEALLAEIAAGSDTAVWEVIERYSKNILRVVRRTLPAEIQNKLDPSDVVQSVWKSLLRRGASAEFSTADRFMAYIVGMARLKVFETHRRFTKYEATNVRREVAVSANQPHDDGDDSGRAELADPHRQTPDAIAVFRENWDLALDQAGSRGLEVVKLRLQGYTLEEIAERLAISKRTVQRVLGELFASLTA